MVDLVETSRQIALVTEFVNGMSLNSFIKAKCVDRVMPEPMVKHIFTQIISAFDYIHSHGISHRDVKLDNILLEPSGVVKIIDFGFAAFTTNSQG